jgi:Phytanoyl-CoA dioxygenase (PhyH)
MALSAVEVRRFVDDGVLRIDQAFSPRVAEAVRLVLWRDSGCDPDDPRTWTRPVIRLGEYAGPPFTDAIDTPPLREAFDGLVGKGRWLPRQSIGTFPLRFPSDADPGDTGWHIDVSFAGKGSRPNDYLTWHANISSRGRALLMLFLFSDVGEEDAPTRIRLGSHRDVARRLAPAGEVGLSLIELAQNGFAESASRREITATGEAGTVYLCHPFLVHAAQPHRGARPRFMAQPPLLPAEPLSLDRADGDYSAVEQAIREALAAIT